MCSEASNAEPYDLHTVGFEHHRDPKLSVLSECMWGTEKTTQHLWHEVCVIWVHVGNWQDNTACVAWSLCCLNACGELTTQYHCGKTLSVLSEWMWGTDNTAPLWQEVVCVVWMDVGNWQYRAPLWQEVVCVVWMDVGNWQYRAPLWQEVVCVVWMDVGNWQHSTTVAWSCLLFEHIQVGKC